MKSDEITIGLDRYNELIAKETVYELAKTKVQNDKYATDNEKMLFGLNLTPCKAEEDF